MNSERELPPEVIEALNAGHKIEAIKRLREARGLGLKEAKHIVDAEMRKHPGHGSQPAISSHGGGCGSIVVALIAAGLAVAAYHFLAGGD